MPSTLALARLDTPALVLDEARMMRNVRRLAERAQALNVTLRPHLKTAKSTDVASRVLGGGPAPITVSTLAEAEMFHAAGYSDILYAVGIAPGKLARVAALRAAGCDLKVILDSAVQAQAVAETGIPALIEIDSDGHRGGVSPDAAVLIEIGQILHRANVLVGVMTHAGESYTVSGAEAHAAFAERERAACVQAAEALRAAGLPCPIVSVGSTPTAHAARDLSGVTELRAGVYMFFDLVMAGIEVCSLDDIALSVLTSVIGHQPDKGWILIDAGSSLPSALARIVKLRIKPLRLCVADGKAPLAQQKARAIEGHLPFVQFVDPASGWQPGGADCSGAGQRFGRIGQGRGGGGHGAECILAANWGQ